MAISYVLRHQRRVFQKIKFVSVWTDKQAEVMSESQTQQQCVNGNSCDVTTFLEKSLHLCPPGYSPQFEISKGQKKLSVTENGEQTLQCPAGVFKNYAMMEIFRRRWRKSGAESGNWMGGR